MFPDTALGAQHSGSHVTDTGTVSADQMSIDLPKPRCAHVQTRLMTVADV